jgi:hypothetical protein
LDHLAVPVVELGTHEMSEYAADREQRLLPRGELWYGERKYDLVCLERIGSLEELGGIQHR